MKKKFDFNLGLKEDDDDVDAINFDNSKISLNEPKRGPLAAVKESMMQIKTGGLQEPS